MYVKDWMTKNPICLSPSDTITDAFLVMKKGDFHRVPITEGTKLVGLITRSTLSDFAPSKATSLSAYEINSLLNKTTCGEIMKKEVYTISPDALLEEAADKMNVYNVTCLPVVDSDNNIVGIITQKVIFGAFIDMMGYYSTGSRLVIDVQKDEIGILKKLSTVLAEANINITHFVVTRYDSVHIILRVSDTDDGKVAQLLESNGFKISDHRSKKA